MVSRRVQCDVCGEENLKGFKRKKCQDCSKMMCRMCTAVLQGEGDVCPECREERLLYFVADHNQRTSDKQIAVSFQGHVIYGVPRLGPHIRYND